MAETFMFSIAEEVLERLGSFIIKEIGLALSVRNDLRDFVDTLSDIKCFLLHAEVKQAENPNLKTWLGKLRDVCYDAEDMIDEYEYESLRQQETTHRSIKHKVRNFFSHSCIEFSVSMADKLGKIKKRLKDIATNKDDFRLDRQDQDTRIVNVGRETHSFVHASDVIGRDEAKEKIIPVLLCASDRENVSVIPIVGIAGLGKTTFAKLLYNDERVVGHFHIKIWVYVSDDPFDVKMLMEKILNSAANRSSDHDLTSNNIMQTRGNLTLNGLQTRLRSTLREKRYLLILDDVWNEDRAKWIDLKDSLMEGANGSKIIVTTRSESVAFIVGTVDPYKLEGLLEKQCLELFVKWAFREGEENQYPELLKVGEEIVRKCSRVPLEVRTLGSLLYLKRDLHDWKDVKDSKMWELKQKENDILPSLRLSYDNLPSHLKQCFAFCSVFPKGYILNSLELIRLWIAQRLLYSSDENAKLEDIGRQYVKELSLRSFFQNVEEYGIVLTFEMHDLIHALASSVAQTSKNYSGSDRHVSIFGDSPSKDVTGSLPKQNNVRTIIFPVRGAANESFAKTCISRFKYLRVLDLRDSHFEVLPSSISKLKLLRYLNLYNSSLKKLPGSICNLLYLQTLELSQCTELEELPKDIGNLIHLRCLYITTKQVCLPEEGIGRLKSLRFLGIVRCSNLKTLGWVQHLTALQTLLIEDCRSLESLPDSMQGLSALETLFIYNCKKLNLMQWEEDNQDCSLNLRSSWFASLPQLVALPEWLKRADNTLQHLCIGDCHNLTALPEWLQNLMSLQKLVIEDCLELSALPKGMRHLRALRDLKIKHCPKLGSRCKRVTGEDWPKIAHVKKIILDEETSDVAGTSEPRND